MIVPESIKATLTRIGGRLVNFGRKTTRARRESNAWLRAACPDVTGRVLSIGSGDDGDGQGRAYREYFARASSYETSEISVDRGCDLVLDVRAMPAVADGAYDAVFCSGVLEHTDDFQGAMAEITRILRSGGILLLGLPFRQPIHMPPQDFWRFTEFGIRRLLDGSYAILELAAIDQHWIGQFPATYWVKARRRE